MRTGRIRRTARRGVVALVLGWLALMVGSLLLAPSASAAPAVTVYVRDLTPPLVSVDQNGTVTFINQIQDKSTGVGVAGLVAVTATVHTDVTLALPSGSHPLQAQPATDPDPEQNSSWKEQFKQSCVTCTITYAYRVTFSAPVAGNLVGQLTGQALQQLGMPASQVVTYDGRQITVAMGVPTPFVVNTLLPLPNLPSVNIPPLPQVNVPVPGAGTPPDAGGAGGVAGGGTTTTTTTTTTRTAQGIDGTQYAYDTGDGAPRMAPVGSAGAAFDPSRFSGGSSGSYGADLASGSGGEPGSYDGASVPLFALDGTKLADASATTPALTAGWRSSPLSVPALVAVVALTGVFAALVRTHQASRAATRR